MRDLPELFANNREWAAGITGRQPGFFEQLARQQTPRYLWIGCADSRIPPNELLGLLPGDLFVHRNVANLVVHTDLNCLSVLQYAVDVLQVEHVIICGHYGCGGVQAAWRGAPLGLIDNWLRHVQDIATRHHGELDVLGDDETRIARLCELNVIEQAVNVCRTTIVQDAWRRGQRLVIHGWIYSIRDGLLRDLGFTAASADELAEAHDRAVAQ